MNATHPYKMLITGIMLWLILVTTACLPAQPTSSAKLERSNELAPTLTPTPTFTPTSTPTITPTPTETPLPTNTLPPTPTPTETSTPTMTPVPSATPLVCPKKPTGEFTHVWQTYKNALGCPIQTKPLTNDQLTFVEQPFSMGHMFFFGSGDVKFVIVKYGTGNEGEWLSFNDQWDGRNSNHCPEAQNIQPPIVRGFNLIWCIHPEIREPLGSPQDIERDLNLELAQGFEKGFIVRDSDGFSKGLVYMFFNNGTYLRVPY